MPDLPEAASGSYVTEAFGGGSRAQTRSELSAAPFDSALALQEGSARSTPSFFSLEPGEIRSVAVDGVTRVAVGNPGVADVSIVSLDEILLQAKAAGTTNLIVWDKQGQSVSSVEVLDRTAEAVADQLHQVLRALDLPQVQVKREKDKIFLIGQVSRQEDLDLLEQMISAYKGVVTNLVSIPPPPLPPPSAPLPSIRLTVQLIEMNHDSTDKLGVDWVDSVTFTETTFGALGPGNVSAAARLGEAFRLGALSRTGLNSVVNMLISKGKARILAEPKLVSASGKEATTFLGVEVPVITATSISSGTVTQNIDWKKTGVELKFQPTVLEDQHSIQLIIDASVASIDKSVAITVSGILIPGFKTRHTQTEIVTESGQAVLITGLLQDEEKKNLSQIPGVGSIPVLGNLFRSTEFTTGQTELIIIVTPELTADAQMSADRTFVLEQALSNAELAGAVNDPTLRYALQIQDRIARSIRYPSRERELGIGGRVKLRLHLFRDGTLGRAVVSESSGFDVFDAEALKAAESQSPYPPFPLDLGQQDLWIEVPVLFRP